MSSLTKLEKRYDKVFDETKALEDIGTILRNVKTAIFKKRFGMKLMSKKHWKKKTEAEKLKKVNKIK